MNEDRNIKTDDEINLREIFLIFTKRKWWFISVFLFILIIGLCYVFLKPVNHIATYQIELKENYVNADLSKFYPNYEKEINYLTLENIPFTFKSDDVYKHLSAVDKDIDYKKILNSESVQISLNKGTSIFDISVSSTDYDLAVMMGKTLIDEFESSIINQEKTILNEIVVKIEQDIKDIENKNSHYENTVIANIKDK